MKKLTQLTRETWAEFIQFIREIWAVPVLRGVLLTLIAIAIFLTNSYWEIIPSRDSINRRRLMTTIDKARSLGSRWNHAVEDASSKTRKQLQSEKQKIMEKIFSEGLSWKNHENLTYLDVQKMIYIDRVALGSDGWGNDFEFIEYDGLLVVRSPGADEEFDGDFYESGFPFWPSGGDIVFLGDEAITHPIDF